MAEYIERDEAIRKAQDACIKIVFRVLGRGITQFDAFDIVEKMESVPVADVVEVKHGHWISGIDTICSVCGIDNDIYEVEKCSYCPNCGAKMDGRSDNDDR